MPTRKIAIGAMVALILVGAYWGLSETGVLSALGDQQALRDRIERLGFWGPLALIVLMTAAIVMSPIPSGPIALAAGAAYGPLWGTVYVVAGAEAGALIAFAIARYLGQDRVQRWVKGRFDLDLAHKRSQTALMAVVFASRLVPFVSSGVVSYAAGLTPLAFWRFAAAPPVGVVPISFAILFRRGAGVGERRVLGLGPVLVGGVTLVPIGLRLLRSPPAGTTRRPSSRTRLGPGRAAAVRPAPDP